MEMRKIYAGWTEGGSIMREILFRGKRLDNGEWVKGGIYIDDPQAGIMTTDTTPFNVAIIDEVDPATVGQYTGLTDKHGVRVFEGDRISAKYPLSQGYYFGTSAQPAAFEIKYGDGCLAAHNDQDQRFFLWELKDVELIDGVHDNPEMMDGKQWTE